MKTPRILYYLCIIACTLMSCNRISPDWQDEMDMQVAELSTFLNDNYTIGDSVYFQNWQRNSILNEYIPKDIRGFVVTENYIKPFTRTILGIDDAAGVVGRLEGYNLVLVLQGGADKLHFELTCGIENERIPYSCGKLLVNDIKTEDDYNGITIKEDSLTVMGKNAYFVLQRNVGILLWCHRYKNCTSIQSSSEWRLLTR